MKSKTAKELIEEADARIRKALEEINMHENAYYVYYGKPIPNKDNKSDKNRSQTD